MQFFFFNFCITFDYSNLDTLGMGRKGGRGVYSDDVVWGLGAS